MRCFGLFAILVAATMPVLADDVPDYIAASHRQAIRTWLNDHPTYRLATPADCQCDDDIKLLRQGDGGAWAPQPSYEPYAAVGDFDGDGVEDLAVVAIPAHSPDPILVVVSFGSKSGRDRETVVIPEKGASAVDRGLFVRPPNPGHRRWRLLFGAFGSEADEVPIKRKTRSTS